jgi:hypothetical protein
MQNLKFSDLPEEATIDLIKHIVGYISAIECTPDNQIYIHKKHEDILDALTRMCTFSEKFSKFVIADQKNIK